jgi:hypothetical protein
LSTQYSLIYDRFLSKITDYDLANLTDQELESTLLKYLRNAVANFKYCTKDLKNRDDALQVFNIDLNEIEQEIIAKLMVIEWVNPYINTQENIRQVLGSNDYKIYSPANLLDKLLSLRKAMQNEVQNDLTFYYYAT